MKQIYVYKNVTEENIIICKNHYYDIYDRLRNDCSNDYHDIYQNMRSTNQNLQEVGHDRKKLMNQLET